MKVYINNKAIDVVEGCENLNQLLDAEGLNGAGRAVAVDNILVKKADWEKTLLADGMKITVIRAVCGG